MASSRDERPAPGPGTIRRRRLAAIGILLAVAIAATAAVVASRGGDVAQEGAASSAAQRPDTPAPVAVTPTTAASIPPGMVRGAAARRTRIPILMYHVIAKAPPGQPLSQLWVPRATFLAHMRALRRAGYTAVTMDQATDGWQDGAPLPEKPIVLTFDDGYLSHSTAARPILKRFDWPGVLYLTTRNIGPTIPKRSVEKLLESGWELGAHTVTHADLTTLDAAGLTREIDDARIELRARFDQQVEAFCYPTGANNATVRAAVKAAGFRTATTVVGGVADRADDPYALPRVRVDPTDTANGLLEKIRAYRTAANPARVQAGYGAAE